MSKTKVEEMTFEDIKKSENKISWLLWNAFYEWNGEPLLQSEIDDFINSLEHNGLKIIEK